MLSKGLNTFQLKFIAVITMLIDHIATVIFVAMYTPFVIDNVINLEKLPTSVLLAFSLRQPFWIIGRIAFPIFCFLLVEGFIHTKNIKKYIMRLFIFSILSEIPHDLAFYNTILEFSLQNVIITLLIGILTLYLIKKIEDKYQNNIKLKTIFICIAILTGTIISMAIKCEFSNVSVLAISLMYIFRKNKILQIVGGAIPLMTKTFWVLPAFVLIALYNKKQGIKMKYLFYWFYPVHFLLLYLISIKL